MTHVASSVLVVLGTGLVVGAALWWGQTGTPAPTTAGRWPDVADPPRTRPASAPWWRRPRFPDRQDERNQMVARQIAIGTAAVRDPRVLVAMRHVPRHHFVPSQYRAQAYRDTPLPIGHGQTISQPRVVALMTEALDLSTGENVLEVGTGCGYQAAVLAEITPHVFTIEIVEPLAKAAAARLERLGYTTVQVRAGDGYNGWPEAAPFDAIIVTCAAPDVPEPLIAQLAVGGRLVIPVGAAGDIQHLVVITRQPSGQLRERLMPVRFVPMTGRAQPEPR